MICHSGARSLHSRPGMTSPQSPTASARPAHSYRRRKAMSNRRCKACSDKCRRSTDWLQFRGYGSCPADRLQRCSSARRPISVSDRLRPGGVGHAANIHSWLWWRSFGSGTPGGLSPRNRRSSRSICTAVKLADGEKALLAELAKNPKDDQARFGLGVLQFVQAVEHLGQSLYRNGLRSDRGQQLGIPVLRLPVPLNPNPETLTYAKSRAIVQQLVDDLAKAEKTLGEVRDDNVKLPIQMGRVQLDLTGDGKGREQFYTIVNRYIGGAQGVPKDADWLVAFDRGDVAWFRGYCHLLMALGEIGLAHDGHEFFDCVAHVFFQKVDTPHKFLTHLPAKEADSFGFGGVNFLDLIAVVHLTRFPIQEPARMQAALTHLERMLALEPGVVEVYPGRDRRRSRMAAEPETDGGAWPTHLAGHDR